jgi:hypothetical protein|tara:strand:+ start:151 stop:336 length:186 start_codon:yes stop_codon:yes gene_type:complete
MRFDILIPLMLEVNVALVETPREEIKSGMPPDVVGFRMLETGTPLMLERNTSPVETDKEET